jgi:hypothetical protein
MSAFTPKKTLLSSICPRECRACKACVDDATWVDSLHGTGKHGCSSGAQGGVAANPAWCTQFGQYSDDVQKNCPVACGLCKPSPQSTTFAPIRTTVTIDYSRRRIPASAQTCEWEKTFEMLATECHGTSLPKIASSNHDQFKRFCETPACTNNLTAVANSLLKRRGCMPYRHQIQAKSQMCRKQGALYCGSFESFQKETPLIQSARKFFSNLSTPSMPECQSDSCFRFVVDTVIAGETSYIERRVLATVRKQLCVTEPGSTKACWNDFAELGQRARGKGFSPLGMLLDSPDEYCSQFCWRQAMLDLYDATIIDKGQMMLVRSYSQFACMKNNRGHYCHQAINDTVAADSVLNYDEQYVTRQPCVQQNAFGTCAAPQIGAGTEGFQSSSSKVLSCTHGASPCLPWCREYTNCHATTGCCQNFTMCDPTILGYHRSPKTKCSCKVEIGQLMSNLGCCMASYVELLGISLRYGQTFYDQRSIDVTVFDQDLVATQQKGFAMSKALSKLEKCGWTMDPRCTGGKPVNQISFTISIANVNSATLCADAQAVMKLVLDAQKKYSEVMGGAADDYSVNVCGGVAGAQTGTTTAPVGSTAVPAGTTAAPARLLARTGRRLATGELDMTITVKESAGTDLSTVKKVVDEKAKTGELDEAVSDLMEDNQVPKVDNDVTFTVAKTSSIVNKVVAGIKTTQDVKKVIAQPTPTTASPPKPTPKVAACTCANGSPATGTTCISDGEVCAKCNNGFWLDLTTGTCKAYSCTCENGIPASGADCTSNKASICAECNTNFTIDFATKSCKARKMCTGTYQETGTPPSGTPCVGDCIYQTDRWGKSFCYTTAQKSLWGAECVFCPVDCICPHGNPATGAKCTVPGATICKNCSVGFFLNSTTSGCQATTCSCLNGTAATGALCTSDGGHICASCDTSFFLSNVTLRCQAAVCTCQNGAAATGTKCPSNGAVVCESCSTGFFLRPDHACQANVCTCRDGTAAAGVACTTHNMEKCISCNPGFNNNGTHCKAEDTTSHSQGFILPTLGIIVLAVVLHW